MKRRKSNAEPEIELKLQNVGKFSEEETEQIMEDLADLLISAWQRPQGSDPKAASQKKK